MLGGVGPTELVIILFIILEPEGLVGIWIRIRDYFRIWPLPYISE